MSDFGNIFSDLPDTLDEWLSVGKDLGSAAISASKSEQDLVDKRKKSANELLRMSTGSVPVSRFTSTKSEPVKSEDPLAYENFWKSRLSTFAEIDRNTGIKVGK